ncbi:hypothetical protein [Bradyrhizobium elkanii]|uniref:hypothetical protein n=1 Tax=Bradyrhizobium elkanii TaxID=29448 RepID=UPI00272BE8A3|nr:hypothetical protein [Bradyrhizobium elkanii]WLA80358.1 hypothetical protein QNJ99_33980 [Bradyrhizobium elkanii]
MTALAIDITPEMEALLRAGAENRCGLCCIPGEVRKNWEALREAERLGYIRFLDITRPWVTDEGRRAVGLPSELEASRAALRAALPKRKPLVPSRDNDPRTDFDYRSYRACGYVCILAVKQPDYRSEPGTLRIGRTVKSDPQFLGARNSIILPESEGRFVLALVPDWLARIGGLSTHPLPIDEADLEWSDDERALWDRLRAVCFSVNSRIRTAGRKVQRAKMRYGETA